MNGDVYRRLKFSLEAGDPLVPALRDEGGRFRKAASWIERGESLADAMKASGFPRPDRLYGSVGEQGGKLEQAFDALAEYYDCRAEYSRRLTGALFKGLVVMGIGLGGLYLVFRAGHVGIPLWLRLWVVGVMLAMGLGYFLFQMLAPGFSRWSRIQAMRFSVQAGLSFEDIKHRVGAVTGGYRIRADQFSSLMRWRSDEQKLVMRGERTGMLEDALLKLEDRAREDMVRWMNRLERTFYYGAVVLVLVTILVSVLAFALAGFRSIGTHFR